MGLQFRSFVSTNKMVVGEHRPFFPAQESRESGIAGLDRQILPAADVGKTVAVTAPRPPKGGTANDSRPF